MAQKNSDKHASHRKFKSDVGKKEERKLWSRERKDESTLYGLGVIGLIGWSVVIPTLAGVALGRWIDSRWPSSVSWTITLMLVGLALGSLNAWHWISGERKRIEKDTHRKESEKKGRR